MRAEAQPSQAPSVPGAHPGPPTDQAPNLMGLREVKQQQVGGAAQVCPEPHPHPRGTGTGPGWQESSLFSTANHSSPSPGSAGPALPQRSQNTANTLHWSDCSYLFRSPRDSRLFKVTSGARLQAHPTVPSVGKARLYIQKHRQPGALQPQCWNFSRLSQVRLGSSRRGSLLQSEQGGSAASHPRLITSRGSEGPYRDPKGKFKSLPAAARSCSLFTTLSTSEHWPPAHSLPVQVLTDDAAHRGHRAAVRASGLRGLGHAPSSLLSASPSSPIAPLMAPAFHWSPGRLNSSFRRPLPLTFLPSFFVTGRRQPGLAPGPTLSPFPNYPAAAPRLGPPHADPAAQMCRMPKDFARAPRHSRLSH